MVFGDFDKKYTDKENAKIVILPVPYDGTSTWIKGASKGPMAILEASYNLEFYDIETDSEVFKQGIYTAGAIKENGRPETMVGAVYDQTSYWLNLNKFVVSVLVNLYDKKLGNYKRSATGLVRYPTSVCKR